MSELLQLQWFHRESGDRRGCLVRTVLRTTLGVEKTLGIVVAVIVMAMMMAMMVNDVGDDSDDGDDLIAF